MDSPLAAGSAGDVRSLMARLILTRDALPGLLGTISLAPHQVEAVSRINEALDEFRGAFLCDAVGSGKTYIGLAVARGMKQPVVVAPAALRDMWMEAMRVTHCAARFISVESLSYGVPSIEACDLIIVDEAHHFRNSNTKRYRALARLAQKQPVLLMTATPIHNSRRDFENLAAIFLGARARHLSSHDMTRMVIRRERQHVRMTMPEVPPAVWLEVGDDPAIVASIMRLPPPIPLRDAGEADTLLALGLVRQWTSSEAALVAALKRRRTRAAALESALEAGEHPTEEEIRGWLLGDDAVQLQLPSLFTTSDDADHSALLRAVRVHSAALTEFSHHLPATNFLDDKRSHLLKQIRLAHPSARIIAFASYEATVVGLFERLRSSARVACLTSRGARVAGGRITRRDAVRQFDPACRTTRDSDRIDLLLTTDLLSEGVNLHAASAIVHLDIPWTAARLEQRVGRVARAGSRHSRVDVFGFRPPASGDRVLRASAIVQSKWGFAAASIGAGCTPGLGSQVRPSRASPEIHEALRAILSAWVMPLPASLDRPIAAAVASDRTGFLAVLENCGRCFLLCDAGGGSVEPSDIHDTAAHAGANGIPLRRQDCEHALAQIEEWLKNRMSVEVAGLGETTFLRGRRRIFTRINSFVEAGAPHSRFERERMAERVRSIASSTLGAEDERILGELERSSEGLFQEKWLANTSAPAKSSCAKSCELTEYRIRALLLLVCVPPGAS